jgi:hypothetical protein
VLLVLFESTPSPVITLVTVQGAKPISDTLVTILSHFTAPGASFPTCHLPVLKLNVPTSAKYVTGASPAVGLTVTVTITLSTYFVLKFLAGIHQVVWFPFNPTLAGEGLV